MTVQTEVNLVNGTYAAAIVSISNGKTDRQYHLFFSLSGGGYVTVTTGNAIKLRTGGKTFHQVGEVKTHYKRDGETLLSVVSELNGLINDYNRLA